jgi:hypothetical protein
MWFYLIMAACMRLAPALAPAHPYYVGVVEVEHNAATATVEISVRLFLDDFEETLQKKYPGKRIDLMAVPDKSYTDSCISRYIRQQLQLALPSQPLHLRYVGFERVQESIWCYFEVNDVLTVKQLQVVNRLLYDTRKEQINMHHIMVGGKRQSHQLRNPEATFTVQF